METLNTAQSINQSVTTLFDDHLDEALEEDGHSLQYIAAATPCVCCCITTRHSIYSSRHDKRTTTIDYLHGMDCYNMLQSRAGDTTANAELRTFINGSQCRRQISRV